MPDWSAIAAGLQADGIEISTDITPSPVSGGDISAAWRLRSGEQNYFAKTGPASSLAMFAAEADSLAAIAATEAVRVPAVLGFGATDAGAYLVMEWLHLERPTALVEAHLGEQLALMHRGCKQRFGWHRDNRIGLTPQQNNWRDDWVDFFREQRLRYQLQLALENGFGGELQDQGGRLLKRLPVYFESVSTEAALLHGDLWGGNWGSCGGQPVLFDPAVYYGDRESDIAMTRLFGGFGTAFYQAYESIWPPTDGYRERQALYQLYHVLNHLNLFGSAYLEQAMRLLRELR